MKRVMCVAGTRPEAIKMVSVIKAFQEMDDIDLEWVWSGQHYDYLMSKVFFEELNLPEPDVDLKIGSGSHAFQTANIMLELDRLFKRKKPDIVLAEGDTNTVLATSLTAVKEHIPFGHVEAGLRSHDRVMPEEINRCVAGICSELNFAPTPNAAVNLLYEGIPPSRVFVTGNTIVDVMKDVVNRERQNRIAQKFCIEEGSDFILLTLHRAENVDSPSTLREVVNSLVSLAKDDRIIFPAHPRTVRNLSSFDLLDVIKADRNIDLVDPLGYFDFLNLLSMANSVMTDSGGVQEEAMVLGVPTVTLRYNTERPETVWHGKNIIAGTNRDNIVATVVSLKDDLRACRSRNVVVPNIIGDGNAGKQIASIVAHKLENGISITSPRFMRTGSAVHKLVRIASPVKLFQIIEISSELLVTLVYDRLGNPLIPYSDLELKEGFKIRVFGPSDSIKALERDLKS